MRTLTAKRIAMLTGGLVLLGALVAPPWLVPVKGADHREAPLINDDGPADIGDIFAFVNPNDPTKVVFALGVNGFAVPSVRGGYSFSPDVLIQFKIDNTGDGREDLAITARFAGFESARHPDCPAVGAQGGQRVKVRGPAEPLTPGARFRGLVSGAPVVTGCTNLILSAGGIRVFAGLRDDPFVVDVGQLFRILAPGNVEQVFRQFTSPVLGALDGRPAVGGLSGFDGFGGFNLSALVVEVPIALVQGTANRVGTYLKNNTTIGVWGTTSRRKTRVLHANADPDNIAPFIQIQRAGQQFFKSVFVFPTTLRDVFNRVLPEDDLTNFGNLVPNALTTAGTPGDATNTIAGRAGLLAALGVTAFPNGAPLLFGGALANTDVDLLRNALLPDVLRLDLARPPAALDVGGNGLQNGRRLGDDVVDILFRVARELADVSFPAGSGVPGAIVGAGPRPGSLDCTALPNCPDRRVLAVLQGADFIESDANAADLTTSGNERPLLADFPFYAEAHPLPGNAAPAPGTVGYPPSPAND